MEGHGGARTQALADQSAEMTWITESRSIPEKGFGPTWGMSSSVDNGGRRPSTYATSEPISGDHTQVEVTMS